MSIKSSEAKSLCTANEFELVQASLPKRIKNHSLAVLRGKVRRARTLRDKYRDLARRQRLEARGKQVARGTRPAQGNERTMRKAELFGEVLERFEKQLGKVEAAAAKAPATKAPAKRPPGKKTPVIKAPAAKRVAPKKAASKSRPVGADAASDPPRSAQPAKALPATKNAQRAAQTKSRRATTVAKQTRISKSGQTKIQGHVSSQVKRQQARRDNRSK